RTRRQILPAGLPLRPAQGLEQPVHRPPRGQPRPRLRRRRLLLDLLPLQPALRHSRDRPLSRGRFHPERLRPLLLLHPRRLSGAATNPGTFSLGGAFPPSPLPRRPSPPAPAGPPPPPDSPVAPPAADSRPATSRSEDSVAADAAAPALPDSPAPCQQPTQPRSQYRSATNAGRRPE